MEFTNTQIASVLRQVAAAYTLKKAPIYQIRAYENAASAVEHSTSEIRDLWEEGQLDQIPGLGENLMAHLDELFRTGKVKHWEDVKKDVPSAVFEFIDIQGVGPKIALELSQLGARDKSDLKGKLESGLLVSRGFSKKISEKILASLHRASKTEDTRMLLPYAFTQAERVIDYMKKCPAVERIEVLGSLRRMVATVGDLDFAIATREPKKVMVYLNKMPGTGSIDSQGERKASVINNLGLRLDFLLTEPENFGALLQHFTGSKQHNIHLRTIAERKGFSLSEYGVKETKSGRVTGTETEERFYHLLGMETPPPEIREDNGEIEAALDHQLPKLVELKDIKGDFHLHDDFPIEPSHDLGASSITEIVIEAERLGYKYIGISDHSPSFGNHSEEEIIRLIEKHNRYLRDYQSKTSIRILNLLEVDINPDGSISVPERGLKLLDFCIASIHSLHQMPKDRMTARIMKALESPHVKILGHPTGRLINKRDSYDADWEVIFKYAAVNNISLEINAFPDRLDLPDHLIRMAKALGVKFIIDTDSHQASQMENMKFGVAVARRGWATTEDILNTWDWKNLAKWYKIKEQL